MGANILYVPDRLRMIFDRKVYSEGKTSSNGNVKATKPEKAPSIFPSD